MTDRPTRSTVEGRTYLDLQNLARRMGRPTDELHQLYALEAFLYRLARSPYTDRFVLKGGVLLAAYAARRPTRDVDLRADAMSMEVGDMRRMINTILAVPVDDGLSFDLTATTSEVIRDGDLYSGVRVQALGRLSAARIHFHVDVSVGDPIVPGPTTIDLPRLLGGTLQVVGYPIESVLAEKIVTAVERGTANTRWRDFVDISALAASREIAGDHLVDAIREVALHREVRLIRLAEVLDGYAPLAQQRWGRWRAKQRLVTSTPERFADLLAAVIAFSDDAIVGAVVGQTWHPANRTWN